MTRLLIVDGHARVRSALCRLLGAESDIHVVGEAGSRADAVRLSKQTDPDVVLLDHNFPDCHGFAITAAVAELGQRSRVIVLTIRASEECAARAIHAGASGFVAKPVPTTELLSALRKVAAGGIYVSPTVYSRLANWSGRGAGTLPEEALSDEETKILLRVARGESTRQISAALRLSIDTVETYRSRLLDRLQLRTNSDMTLFAMKRGLIDTQ